MPDIGASVLAKLKNKAKSSGISYQQCLQLFFQEEFLRRLSKSKYVDNLILKGGLFIYTLTNFESRSTINVDFLLRQQSNALEDVKALIDEILLIPTGNDYISMSAKGYEEISPQRKYKGVSAQIKGRMKDFYDIYYLARTFDFEGIKLQSAIFETLQNRGTPYERNSFKRVIQLADDSDMQSKWKYFLKNIRNESLEFIAVIDEIASFLEPVYGAIVGEMKWQKMWDCKMNRWLNKKNE